MHSTLHVFSFGELTVFAGNVPSLLPLVFHFSLGSPARNTTASTVQSQDGGRIPGVNCYTSAVCSQLTFHGFH